MLRVGVTGMADRMREGDAPAEEGDAPADWRFRYRQTCVCVHVCMCVCVYTVAHLPQAPLPRPPPPPRPPPHLPAQAVWVFVSLLPVLCINGGRAPVPLGPLDMLGG